MKLQFQPSNYKNISNCHSLGTRIRGVVATVQLCVARIVSPHIIKVLSNFDPR